jgi:hypothetical protein
MGGNQSTNTIPVTSSSSINTPSDNGNPNSSTINITDTASYTVSVDKDAIPSSTTISIPAEGASITAAAMDAAFNKIAAHVLK